MSNPTYFNPEQTRQRLFAFAQHLEGLPTFGAPSDFDRLAYTANLGDIKAHAHETGRGIHKIAADMDMSVDEAKGFFVGKAVLDIGCGAGVLASDIERLKATSVVALDSDPDVLDRVKTGRRLEAVQGDGLDVVSIFGPNRFDVVVAAYSSYTWAASPEEKAASIRAALGVCKVGGMVVILPIMQHLNYRYDMRLQLELGRVPGYSRVTPEDIDRLKGASRTMDWGEVRSLRMLEAAEKAEEISCRFVSSRRNRTEMSVAAKQAGSNQPEETYSVIITKQK